MLFGSVLGNSLFGFSFSIFDSLFAKQPLAAEIADDKAWRDAKDVLSDFYLKLNLERYDAARKLLTEDFARTKVNYSVAKLQEWRRGMRGGITLIDIAPDYGSSKSSTKVFSYKTIYYRKNDPTSSHGEFLRAYVVLRDEKWTIDTIQDEEQYY